MTISTVTGNRISISNAADDRRQLLSVTKQQAGGLVVRILHGWPGEGRENDFRGEAVFTVSPADTNALLTFLTGIAHGVSAEDLESL